jgi:hypothetical protein
MEIYRIIDSRTGQPASVEGYLHRRTAELRVLEWRARQARGGRPDLSFETCQALRVVRSDIAHRPRREAK